MHWDETDHRKFAGELLTIVNHNDDFREVIDQVTAHISETLFLYGCPLSECWVIETMDYVLQFLMSPDREGFFSQQIDPGSCRRGLFVMGMAQWVRIVINFFSEE